MASQGSPQARTGSDVRAGQSGPYVLQLGCGCVTDAPNPVANTHYCGEHGLTGVTGVRKLETEVS